MKLKCIKSYDDIVILGKVYDARIPSLNHYKEKGYVEITDENGNVFHFHPTKDTKYIKVLDCNICTDRKCNSCELNKNKSLE